MAAKKENASPVTFTDRMRIWFRWFLEPTARFLLRLGLRPNVVTMLGFLGVSLGAWFVAQGRFFIGGVVIGITVPFDALDGTMARMSGEASDWGAVVDAVMDRYSELITWGGVLYYYLSQGDTRMAMLTYAAAVGTVLVSYLRARGEVQGFEVKTGLMTRVERYLVVMPSLLIGRPEIAVWVLAVLANFTALQRFWHIRQQAWARMRTQAK